MHFYSPKLYSKDPWVYWPVLISVAALAAAGGYLAFKVPSGEGTYFLHNTIVFGVDLIGTYWQLYTPLIVGLLFFVVVNATAFVFYSSERFFTRFLLFFLMLSEVAIAYGVYLITLLNS